MSTWQDNENSSNASRQPDENHPMHSAMNRCFMPQVPFNTPPFIPQYFPAQNCMPYQNMMGNSYSTMMYTMPDQATMCQWNVPSLVQNPSSVSATSMPSSSKSSFSASSQSIQPPSENNFCNLENIPPIGANVRKISTAGSSFVSTKGALTSPNVSSSTQKVYSSAIPKNMTSTYQFSWNRKDESSCNEPQKEENYSRKRAANTQEDQLKKGGKSFKNNFDAESKEAEKTESINKDSKDGSAPKSRDRGTRLLVGTVEHVLKWSSEKKSIISAKFLIQFIGVFVKILKEDQYHHLLLVRGMKPNSPCLQAVFYPIDRKLLFMAPGQTVLFTGHMKGSCKIQVYDFQIMLPSIVPELHRIMQFSDRVVQELKE